MGCQQSTPTESELLEKLADQAINKEMKDAKDKDNSIIKVLLLGSGSSGKTTLCKQMKVLHTSGFTADEKDHYREVILTNVMDILEALVKCVEVMGHKLDEKNQISAEALRKARRYEPELRPYILSLSKDRAIQRAFLSEHRPLDMFDAAPYFWEHLDRILADEFEPTNDDILRCRAATTGIVHTSFLIKNSKFAFYDVGGQKNERKKWIHCFENVTAMLYIANLNEYNQTLVEDTSKNRLEDSLQLFDAVVNMRWFKYTSVIVFLNKNDLFEEKIKSVDLGAFHPQYKDGCNYDKALAWITNEYRRRFKADNKTLYFYVTTATNTKNIEKIWRLVADIIITKNLASLGLQ